MPGEDCRQTGRFTVDLQREPDDKKNWLVELKNHVLQAAGGAEIRLRVHTTVFLAVNGFLFLVNMLTSRGFPWFFFPLAGWAVGLVSHYQVMRNKRNRSKRIRAAGNLSREQVRIISKIHDAEARYKSHRAAFLTGSAFLIGTNLITSPGFPWAFFPVGGWVVGLLAHRAAHRAKMRMLNTNLEALGISWRALTRLAPSGSPLPLEGVRATRRPDSDRTESTSEYGSVLKEVSDTRDSLLRQVEGDEDLKATCGPDFAQLLENYVSRIDSLAAMSEELGHTLSTFSEEDLQKEIDELKAKHEKAENGYVKQEYEKTINQYERQRQSLTELRDQKEVVHLRLTASLLTIRQIQLDLSRMKSMASTAEPASVKLLREKSDELSQYLDDLRSGYQSLSL